MHYKPGQQSIAKITATLSPDEYIKTSTIATAVNISLFIDRNLNPKKIKKAPKNGCLFNTALRAMSAPPSVKWTALIDIWYQ